MSLTIPYENPQITFFGTPTLKIGRADQEWMMIFKLNWILVTLNPNHIYSCRAQTLQCSAKEDKNIREIFKSFLTLSKIPIHQEESSLKRRSSAYVKSRVPKDSSTPHDESPSKILATTKSPQFLTEDSAGKSKPRSRSLIRRSSRKAKQNVRDASTGPSGDCGVV